MFSSMACTFFFRFKPMRPPKKTFDKKYLRMLDFAFCFWILNLGFCFDFGSWITTLCISTAHRLLADRPVAAHGHCWSAVMTLINSITCLKRVALSEISGTDTLVNHLKYSQFLCYVLSVPHQKINSHCPTMSAVRGWSIGDGQGMNGLLCCQVAHFPGQRFINLRFVSEKVRKLRFVCL